MKKLTLLALTLAFMTYSAASNATQFVTDFFSGSNAVKQGLEQQGKTPLILDKYQKDSDQKMAAHYSHSSHRSHYSHSSHRSHYSHYSSGF